MYTYVKTYQILHIKYSLLSILPKKGEGKRKEKRKKKRRRKEAQDMDPALGKLATGIA